MVNDTEKTSDLVIGRNAVREALRAGRAAECLYILRGEHTGPLTPIAAMCRDAGIPVKEVDRKKLDYMAGNDDHQGVILVAAVKAYSTLEDVLDYARERGEAPFILLCDGLQDPHNLGAVIRSAEAAGAHGVVIPERRSVGLGRTVAKSAAGALEYMRVVRVTNMNDCIARLKDAGLWIYAADMDGEPYDRTDLSGPVAIVVGAEGSGVSRLVKKNADAVVSIPMAGHINSLNASVAAGILLFEAARRRRTGR